jgi:hypothetical protein
MATMVGETLSFGAGKHRRELAALIKSEQEFLSRLPGKAGVGNQRANQYLCPGDTGLRPDRFITVNPVGYSDRGNWIGLTLDYLFSSAFLGSFR